MSDLTEHIQSLDSQRLALQEHLDLVNKQTELDDLQRQTEEPEFWSKPDDAQQVMKRITALSSVINEWKTISTQINDLSLLDEMDDGSLTSEITSQVDALGLMLQAKETELLLSGEHDDSNALLAIHAGAGGTEAQDWAAMLERMYLRWAEQRGFKVENLDRMLGEEAGIKSATYLITGKLAYGYLRSERGVHRLVRLSPYDAAHRRHTSFALIEVLPEMADNSQVVINPEEIEIEVYRSSGAGGQNVQKNMTAVRIKHIPSGLMVTCQNERSQTQNRENAMKVLRSRLFEIQQRERNVAVSELKGEYKKMEWGSQIRSYVLHPYQMVKDHRTGFETGNSQAVLDGDLDSFIEAYLRYIPD
ncbi:MAG: peptide chain release factor 2 [Anaerolineaceae bacterium]